MLNMPNVVMKGLTLTRVIIRPLMHPKSVPKLRPSSTAIHGGTTCVYIRRAVIIAEAANTEPTDRSMPPVTMIMVSPMAMIPMVDIPRNTLKMLSDFQK